MAKSKWTKEEIVRCILALKGEEEDLTYSSVKQMDSPLVGAAISYFGNWGNAIEAAGLDYDEIKKISRKKRKQKVQKWSIDKVLEEIKRVADEEDDLSYAYMKEKYSSLVAAATNYMGSWKNALEELGMDYSDVIRTGRKKRIEREKAWRQTLLLERLEDMGSLDENRIKQKEPKYHELLMQYYSSWRDVVSALRKKQKDAGKGM